MYCQSTISRAIGDETIELELTAEQLLELSQAEQVSEPVARPQISAVTEPGRIPPASSSLQLLFKVSPSRRIHSWYQTPIAKMAGATLAYVALAWLCASELAVQSEPPATAAARPTVVIHRPALITSSSKPAVQVVNPFDATEVFEFPAGSSAAEDREKVAQILLQRARERQSQWEHIKPLVSVRTASLYRPP